MHNVVQQIMFPYRLHFEHFITCSCSIFVFFSSFCFCNIALNKEYVEDQITTNDRETPKINVTMEVDQK